MPPTNVTTEEKRNASPDPGYRYTHNFLPCLVKNGAELEDLPARTSDPEYYAVNARNALRYLTYGKPLFKSRFFKWSNLKLAWLNLKALFIKRDKKLLAALRLEMKQIFMHACEIRKQCDPEIEKRLEIFINTLASNLPFMDPETGEEFCLPQRINGQWRDVKYRIRKIDISPKNTWWSSFIEPEDRIYSYVLETQDPEASPYLLLMGTTYFSGQGSGFSFLGDLTPGKSVGERHELFRLEKWILKQRNIKVSGHSQGASQALLIALLYPDQILEVHGLNPAALHQATIKRLLPWWRSPRSRNPELRVYTQKGDPVFIFGDDFPQGTRFFILDHPQSSKDSLHEAHTRHYSGFEAGNFKEVDKNLIWRSPIKRKFLNELKWVADRLLNPLVSLAMIYFIAKRKFLRFCAAHPSALRTGLFFSGLIICVVLMISGVLAPIGAALALPTLQSLVPILPHIILAACSAAASFLAALVLPKVTSLAVQLTQAAALLAWACATTVLLGLSALGAGLRALKRIFWDSNEQPRVAMGLKSTPPQVSARQPGIAPTHKESWENRAPKRSQSTPSLARFSFMAAQTPRGQAASLPIQTVRTERHERKPIF